MSTAGHLIVASLRHLLSALSQVMMHLLSAVNCFCHQCVLLQHIASNQIASRRVASCPSCPWVLPAGLEVERHRILEVACAITDGKLRRVIKVRRGWVKVRGEG